MNIGINWSKLWQAYRVFKATPAQGVLLVLEAQRTSSWKALVLVRKELGITVR